MTTDRPDDRADEQKAVIASAAMVLVRFGEVAATQMARALSNAGLLVSPADQDELCDLCRLFQVALRRESEAHLKTLAEVFRLRMAKANQRDAETEAAAAVADLCIAEARVAEWKKHCREEINNTRAQRLRAERAEAERDLLRDRLAAVRALHYEVIVYAYDDTNGVFSTDVNGERIVIGRICAECSDEDAVADIEDCAWAEGSRNEVDWPCDTIRKLDTAGGDQP